MSHVVELSWREAAQLARPTNYMRNAYHAANGVIVSWLVLHIFSPLQMVVVACGFAAFAWTAEISRRYSATINRLLMAIWAKTAHPHERNHVNSATWIVTGLLIIAVLYGNVVACMGVLACGFGDPAAALFGRRFGRIHLRNGRTLEGSIAFVVVAAFFITLMLMLHAPQFTAGQSVIVALMASLAGALIELWAPVDDNLAIPVAASSGGWLTLVALGLNPPAGWLFTLF